MNNMIPNPYKWSTDTSISNVIRKGNHTFGIIDVEYGPTVDSDYWNGATPPNNGYCIYKYYGQSCPALYVASNDTELVSILNNLGLFVDNKYEALYTILYESNLVIVTFDYENIVMNNLKFLYDISCPFSYVYTDTYAYNISGDIVSSNYRLTVSNISYDDGTVSYDKSLSLSTNSAMLTLATDIIKQNECTLNIWCKTTSNSEPQHLFNTANGSYRYDIYLYPTSNKIDFIVGDNSVVTSVNYSFGINDWININWYWNLLSEQQIIHINGGNKTSSSFTTVSGGDARIIIGNNSTNPFLGNFSILKIYYNQLTDAEVLQNFNATKYRYGL